MIDSQNRTTTVSLSTQFSVEFTSNTSFCKVLKKPLSRCAKRNCSRKEVSDASFTSVQRWKRLQSLPRVDLRMEIDVVFHEKRNSDYSRLLGRKQDSHRYIFPSKIQKCKLVDARLMTIACVQNSKFGVLILQATFAM